MGIGASEGIGVEPAIASAAEIFRRLLVPVDYTMDSHRALGVALDLARTYGSAVGLFHSEESTGADEWLGGIGSPSVGGDWVAEARGRLHRFVENVAPWALDRLDLLASVGDPVHELRRAARSWDASLVVASASVYAGFLRSPAERLVHGFDLPTLILPRAPEPATTRVARPATARERKAVPAGAVFARPTSMNRNDTRKPGRSFDDPNRPLGEDTLARAHDVGANLEGGAYGRAETGAKDTGVADRAKAIAVLRKAEEFMVNDNPSARTPEGMRRALELAAGRVGLTLEEYDAIVRADDELVALERKVLAAHAH